MSPPIEWRFDVTTSPALRLIAHGFVAGFGGAFLLAFGIILVTLPDVLPALGTGPLLFAILLLLVGGPFSLLYLWPMLTDPDQRPSVTAFTWNDERIPWTKQSFSIAIIVGALLLSALIVVDVPVDIVFALVVVSVFSPVVVSLLTTVGRIEDGSLVCNGTTVGLRQVTAVRSIHAGNTVVCWVSYARGTGFFIPRLITILADKFPEVRSSFESDNGSPRDPSPPSPAIRAVLGAAGLLFVGTAFLAIQAIDDPAISIYFGSVTGGLGLLLLIVGWRGV